MVAVLGTVMSPDALLALAVSVLTVGVIALASWVWRPGEPPRE